MRLGREKWFSKSDFDKFEALRLYHQVSFLANHEMAKSDTNCGVLKKEGSIRGCFC